MSRPIVQARVEESRPVRRAGEALQRAAGVVLLCIVVGRAFVGELPFRTSLLDLQPAPVTQDDPTAPAVRADRGELARVSFACLLLADGAMWLVGGALARRLVVREGALLGLIGVFAVLSLASVFVASDKRSAMDVWVEQLAMMAGCFLAVQCLSDRRGLVLTAGALAAVGAVLAAKGVHQVLVEIPETVAYWKAYGQGSHLVGEAGRRAFEARVRATTPTGFWGLSNPLASLLIVCLPAAAGLAADKWRRARDDRRGWKKTRAKGEVHGPTLAAVATGALAVAVAAALVLTRSRGGIAAGALVLIAWAVVMRWRVGLIAHRGAAVAAVVIVFLLGCAGVVGYGVWKDRLPGKSMTFRWHYWTAAARIVEEQPTLGVGPGNFGPVYLRYRRMGAEEAVKLPHNVVAEAASQYGIPGGLAYLAVVAVVLVGMCRPAKTDAPSLEAPARGGGAWRVAIGLAVAAGVSRWLFSEAGAYPILLVFDGIVPAVLLAAAMCVAVWGGGMRRERGGLPATAVRVGLACGVVGMFLHSWVEFSLFMAGTATAFWVAGGACLGGAGGKGRELTRLRWVLAGNALVAVVAAVVILWWPVYRRVALTERAMGAWAGHRVTRTAELAEQAARSDPLDGYAAADAARAILAAGGEEDWASVVPRVTAALGWAGEAGRRDPSYYGHLSLSADVAWVLACPDNYTYSWDRLPPPAAAGQGAVGLASAGKQAYQDGRYGEAAGLFAKAIEAEPESAMLNGYLGDAAWRAGRVEEAKEAWRRAAAMAPRVAEVDEALADMARAVKLNPRDHRLRLQAAGMNVRADRPGECVGELDAAERIDAGLNRESLMRFDAEERAEIRMLRARVDTLAAGE